MYYMAETSTTTCSDCPAGWISEQGSAKCQACEAGTFSSVEGQACEPCTEGQYRQSKESNSAGGFTDKITDPTTCVDCPAGWSSKAGSTKCQACEAGTFSSVEGQACEPCMEGQYRQSKREDDKGELTAESTDPTTCLNCPTGWTSGKGTTKCQACGAGTYGDGCKLCPEGYARNGTDHDATQCRLCKLGETTTSIGGASCERWYVSLVVVFFFFLLFSSRETTDTDSYISDYKHY